MAGNEQPTHGRPIVILTTVGIVLGVIVARLTSDVIIGIIVGAAFIAVTVQTMNLWTGGTLHRRLRR